MVVAVITERVAAPFAGVTVTGTDDAPVIGGVLLCGPVSANRRRYLKSAFEGDRVKLYNGRPVKVTSRHGEVNGLYEEQIGTVENARHRPADGMPVGDIHVNPATELARKFVWDARNKPAACGMSHVAKLESRRAADGWDEMTELVDAISVDVIGAGHAATTKGLAEHKGTGVALTIKALCEALVKHPKTTSEQVRPLKALAEDDFGGEATSMDAPPADDADPDEAISAGFEAAIMAVIRKAMTGGMDPKDALKKIKTLLTSHGDATGDGGTNDDGSEDDDGDPATPESKKPTLAVLFAECKAAGLTETSPELLEALADTTSVAGRAFVIKTAREAKANAAAERPKGGQRQPGGGEAAGGKTLAPAPGVAWKD